MLSRRELQKAVLSEPRVAEFWGLGTVDFWGLQAGVLSEAYLKDTTSDLMAF